MPEWAFGENAEDPAVKADIAKYVSVVNPSKRMIGMAFPGTFMLAVDGRVTSRYFEDFYVERNTVSSIIMRLGEARDPVRAVRLSTPQLDLTTYASEATVAPGNRFAVMLSIAPHDGMHVYAPGSEQYRVVRLHVEPQPHLSLLPMSYPPSKSYRFEPLDETVQIYDEPFELVQEVILDGSLPAQQAMRGQESVTIKGTLDYQACSADVCYPPRSLDLSWTVPLRALQFGPPRR